MMHHFSVWAPRRKAVSVVINGSVYSMHSEKHGWWAADVDTAHHGTDYGFLLDDDPQSYPDPRSQWQPFNVHGSSRAIDHSRYQWKHVNFEQMPLQHAVIYELHIGTFTQEGTFAAAEAQLEAVKGLGITHVELMPLNSFTGLFGWGYDGVSLFAPFETYGGPEALKHFVDTCHQIGLAVLLDVVYNHFGPVGNYTGKFGNYITDSHHTPWGGAVNLEEYGSTEVRRFFIDNALMWLRDYSFDGLRLDAVQTFIDRSATHFLEQLANEVRDLGEHMHRKLILIAESDLNDPKLVTPHVDENNLATFGYGLDAQWSDDFHHALFAYLTGQRGTYYSDFGSLAQLAKSIKSIFVYDGVYSEFRGRYHGRPVGQLRAHHFLGYSQNHDQIGNQAFGDRLCAVAGNNKAKLAAALVLTGPFVPMLFQGEEYAASTPFLYFANHDDPILAKAVSEGRRLEHAHEDGDAIPDPESSDTFQSSKLIWSERSEPSHQSMLDWYKSLIELRRSTPALLDGDLDNLNVSFSEEMKWLIVERSNIKLLYNFSDDPQVMDIGTEAEIVLASEPIIQLEAGKLRMSPNSFAALKH